MKIINKNIILGLVTMAACLNAQNTKEAPNLIIITTDGLRTEEVFGGLDSKLAFDNKINEHDSASLSKKFQAATPEERRAKLMPFIWKTFGEKGQVFGNQQYNNKIQVSNPYAISYPGYAEMFCGFVDNNIKSNNHPNNPHSNVLDFIALQPAYKGKIAAFTAWKRFNEIFNRPKAQYPIFSAFDIYQNQKSNAADFLNKLNIEAYKPFKGNECLDVFLHNIALDYIKTSKPKVIYISYGETDEWAHAEKYSSYLHAAKQFDTYVKEIYDFISIDPFYKNNTSLVITTDHGRGNSLTAHWDEHNHEEPGSENIWFMALGPKISPKGEHKTPNQLHLKQMASTWAQLLNLEYKAEHEVAPAIPLK